MTVDDKIVVETKISDASEIRDMIIEIVIDTYDRAIDDMAKHLKYMLDIMPIHNTRKFKLDYERQITEASKLFKEKIRYDN